MRRRRSCAAITTSTKASWPAQSLELADAATVRDVTGAPVGFAGPVGLRVCTVADPAVAAMSCMVTGANATDKHLLNVRAGRDFEIDHVADIRFATDGDACPRCAGGRLSVSRGIEIAHLFKLGTQYSEKMEALFLDGSGSSHPVVMGCYGIGINRIMAARVETHHDEHGIIWSAAISPYSVLITPVGGAAAVTDTADKLYEELLAAGVDVLLDDRDARAGVKFNDGDLIGIPLRVVVGERGLEHGEMEIKQRQASRSTSVSVADGAAAVREALDRLGQTL